MPEIFGGALSGGAQGAQGEFQRQQTVAQQQALAASAFGKQKELAEFKEGLRRGRPRGNGSGKKVKPGALQKNAEFIVQQQISAGTLDANDPVAVAKATTSAVGQLIRQQKPSQQDIIQGLLNRPAPAASTTFKLPAATDTVIEFDALGKRK